MKKPLRFSVVGAVVALGLMQFWQPARNEATRPGENDINTKYAVPPKVRQLLQHACYDCHSNHTRYPWYASVQPVRWWLDYHINNGKQHLDFSDFASYSDKHAAYKLGQISDELDDGTMPLKSYTWIHADARLTHAQKRLITDWADNLHDELSP